MKKNTTWLKDFIPPASNASKQERLYACIGIWIGLIITEWLSRISAHGTLTPWFLASMGSSAMLLFTVPSSPFAQPWSILGGNLVSAFAGILCTQWIGHTAVAVSSAGALSIALMFSLRCMHPPGVAVALTAVLGGSSIRAMGYSFILWPVATNSFFLLLTGLFLNNILKRPYPHQPIDHTNPHHTKDLPPLERLGFSHPDFMQALASHKELVDIHEDDLEKIFLQAEMHAHRRHFGEIRCIDIMSGDIISLEQGSSQHDAWKLLREHKIEVLPVHHKGKLIGIVTQYDLAINKGDKEHVKVQSNYNKEPEQTINTIMQREITTAYPEQPVIELVPLFINGDVHHLPVVDAEQHILGMVTQSDILAALFRAQYRAPDALQAVKLPSQAYLQ